LSSILITSSSFLRVSALSLLLSRPPAVVIISHAACGRWSGSTWEQLHQSTDGEAVQVSARDECNMCMDKRICAISISSNE
jgi:hypothetical protein